MSDIDKFLDEPVSDTPATTGAVDSFMKDAPDTAKGFGGALRDTAVAAGSSAVTGVQLLANAAGADNAVAQKLGDAAEYVRGFETEARREERAARAAKIKAAEESGSTWEEIKANVGAFGEAPIDTTVEALGTSVPTIAAALLTRGKLRAPVTGAIGAAQGAGTVKGSIYDAVEQEHLNAGATPEEAQARAAEAQAYAGDNAGQVALGAGLGAVAGTTGIEGAIGRLVGREAGEAAAQGVVRSTLMGAAKEAPLEAAQGGQERLASNLALQNEGFDTPTWQGVAGQAALEGVAGAAGGGGFGAVEGMYARSPQPAPEAEPVADQVDEALPVVEPVAEPAPPAAGPLSAGMAPPQVPPQYRTERPYPAKPSEQMGLDPAAGPLSDAAATAVDSGASAQLAQQAALQQAAEQEQKGAKKGAKAGEQIDTATGEITQAAGDLLAGDSAAELQDRLNFVKQAARANGWDASLVAERDRLQSELDALPPGPDAGYMDRVSARAKRIDAAQSSEEVAAVLAEDQADPQRNEGGSGRLSLAASARNFALEQVPPASLQEGITQAQARRAQAKPADQADVSPETVTAPAAAEASTQPAADQSAGDIKAITAKQIPQMTDAELAQAIEHYGSDHKRTAKLQKEQAKRTTQGVGNVPKAAETVEASPQPAQVAGQAPATDAQAAGAATAGSAASVDHGARWEAMSRDERQALAEKSGVKPVFVKSLPGAPWDRIGDATKQKLAAAMADEAPQNAQARAAEQSAPATSEPAVRDPHIERMRENKRLLARPSRELVAQAEAMGIHDADQHSNVESLEARMKARQEHESRDIGGGWYAFHPDSGTVGIPRAEMPQIKAEHRGAMVNFLNARGVQHGEATVPASALKPTQAEFSRDKVAKARDFEGGNRSILISQDGHVLDGHHQWLAAREKGEDVKVISLDAPIRELVKLAHEFPSSTADTSSESAASPSEQVESKQADEYAARLRKLGDEFQGSYSGRSLAPLARAMADHAIEQGRRLTDAEISDMGRRFDVPADVVEQLTGNIFTFDALLGDAQRRDPGAVALRKRQSQAGAKQEVERKQSSAMALPNGVKLDRKQEAERAQGGAGLAGELGEATIRSLAAMRDNPNVPSPKQDEKTGGYSPNDLPAFRDVGDGFAVRGYALRQRVVQEIKLPNGMIARRVLNADGTLYGEFEGNYDQIVGRQGFAEAQRYFQEFAEAREGRSEQTGTKPSSLKEGIEAVRAQKSADDKGMPPRDQGPHFAAGKSAAEQGLPRELPSYFTGAGKNSKDWLRGWDSHKPAGTSVAVRAIRAKKSLAAALEPLGFADKNASGTVTYTIEGFGRRASLAARVIVDGEQLKYKLTSATEAFDAKAGRMKAAGTASDEVVATEAEAVATMTRWLEADRKFVRNAGRAKPGDADYTLELAREDLAIMQAEPGAGGMVTDSRAQERIRRQEKLIQEMEAEQAAAAELPSDDQLELASRSKKIDKTLDLMDDAQIEAVYARAGLAGKNLDIDQKRQALKQEHPDDIEPLLKPKAETDRTPEWAAEMEAIAAKLDALGRNLQATSIRKNIAKDDGFPAATLLETAKDTLAKFDQPAADKPADADLDAMFDDVLAEVTGEPAAAQSAPAVEAEPADEATVESLEDELRAQKKRVMRLKGGDATKLKAAETRLRKMRTGIFEAEDRLVPAARAGDAKALQALDEMGFADTADAIRAFLPANTAPRSLGDSLGSAGKNVASALDEAINGLGQLFGGSGRLSSGLTFDEETYAKAKPLFISAVANLRAASADLRDAMRAVVSMVVDRFGAEAAQNMKPYVVRFIGDVRDGKVDLENNSEQPANGAQDQGRAQEVRSGRSAAQPGAAQADTGDVAAEQPADGRATDQAGDSGRPGIRGAGANVAGDGSEPSQRDADNGRAGAGRAGSPDAGAGARVSGAPISDPLSSPAASAVTAQDLHIANPLEIVGGTPVQRFNRNRAALELLQTLDEEGRQATPDEQKVLAGYIGWGSFGQELFQGSWEYPQYKDEGVWRERGEWLRATLGESAWKSAQRSITNAHYTDPPTVMAMWDMVRRMGFTGGKVLEPSMGTGNFYSMMPADLKARSQLTGIELDETTGAIAKQLFPQSNIRVMGYQESKTPDNFYDLVIGNWPFENTPIADRRYNKLNPMLHDYFFLKTLDQVRPGGIVIGITSAGSMDKQNTSIRREMAKQAELVASIRLPSGAFSDYAGTKVVTDIVILRKRPERLVAVPNDAAWVDTGEFQAPGGKLRVNQYYLSNPQNIIGQLDFGHGTTTFRAGMIVHRPENMAERLQQAVQLVPQGAMLPAQSMDHLNYFANATGERHGAVAEVSGRLMVARGDQLVLASDVLKYELKDAKKTAEREQQIKSAIGLRKLHSALVDAERAGQDAAEARKALRAGYQAFVKAHGPLRESFALDYMRRVEDPFYAELAALEGDDGKPAAVMERSTTRSRRTLDNPSVRDAYVLARNQAVSPSIEQVAELAGKPADEVRAELIESGAVFVAPNGDIVPSDLYLSGNVREKMREAQAALADGNAGMQRNIKALGEVMPADVPYFNIETKLGATWVTREAYQGYIAHMLSRTKVDGIDVEFRGGRWKVRLADGMNQLPEANANFGTNEYPFSKLVQAAMSNQTLRLKSKDADGNEVYDPKRTEEVNSRVQKIREDFGAWLWSDPERRVEHEREYNEARNAWATPKYDGSFLALEGMALTLGSGQFNLRQHQVNAIWRAIVNRRSINAHEVGTGKTFTMGGIAVESRRYGIAKKPVILAHNANSAAVAAEIRMMYPSARVLYVDNLDPKNRDVRLRQIANDDWDAVVMPHSLIDRLALREDTLMQMAEDDIAALEAEFFDAAKEDGQNFDSFNFDFDDDEDMKKVRSVTAKELAKARKRIIENIKKQAQQASKEGAVTFEDLGIDMILVDEVHEFKKPPIVTRMQMKGLNTQTSGRSIALQFLTRYVRQMNNGGNIHTFTGTPITNTITEIYHQMRYVMESEMDQAGVSDWDGWFGSFATEVQDVELSAAGDYEMVTRLAGFVNVPELRRMVGQYMDTVFAEDMPEMKPRKTASGKTMTDDLSESERAELLNGRTEGAMDRPYKKVINASADMTDEQLRIFTQLQQYAVEWRNASGKQRKEWSRNGDPRSPMISGNIADMASFDVRRLDESLAGMEGKTQDDPNSKVSRAVANVLEIYRSHPQANQVIFSDQGTNKTVRRTRTTPDGDKVTTTHKVFATSYDIVERLVQGGIPRDQIAIVDGSTSKEKRKEIAKAMNESRIRVVLGSTDALGVGVNMQRNLRAMHHLDAPYMPGELEQRNGRGQRQGNQWNTVLEYRYMTDRLDGKRWQILAVKQRFITAFMKANSSVRSIEGEAAADEQSDILESFSEAAGDPRVLQRVKMQKKVESLQRKERMYSQGVADMRSQARYSEREADELRAQVERSDSAGVQAIIEKQRESFTAQIAGKNYTERKDALAALDDYLTEHARVGDKKTPIGTYAGLPLSYEWSGLSDAPTTSVEFKGERFSGKGIAGIEAKLRNYPSKIAELERRRDAALATVQNMREAMKQPFAQADDLQRAVKQLADLEKDLEVNPVPPPAWLRQGAPIDAEVFRKGRQYIVTGHRYSSEGWFVIAEDDKGTAMIPYMEATDSVGMPLYEEREFTPPTVQAKAGAKGDAGDTEAPLFSRRPVDVPRGATPVLSHDAVKAIVERIGAGLKLGIPSRSYRSETELYAAYPEIAEAAERDDAKGQVNAVYYKGQVHVVTSAFVFEADVEGAVLEAMAHEGQGHYGIRALHGNDGHAVIAALREFFAAIGGVAGVKRLAGKHGIDMSLYLETASQMTESRRAIYLADELLAHLQGREAVASLSERARAAVRALYAAVREMLSRIGAKRLAKGSDADISLLLARMRRASKRTATASKGAPRFSLRPPQTASAAFKRWFGDSKVVGADGEPLHLYHGTGADFTVFDQSRAGSATGHATSALGIFMSSDRRAAQNYAEKASDGMPGYGRVMDLYASIQNPYLMSVEESQEVESPLEARRLRTRLEQQGYDGIRLKGTPVWIAFNNYQVKSATDNVGTFDEFDPDIRFSRSAVRDMASNAANAIASVSVQDVKRSALGKWTDFLSLGLQSLGRRQLVDLYDGMLPMRKYAKLVERMDADKNDTGAAADELARRWGKLKDSGKLADLMHEATLAQTDADPLVPESKAVNPGRRDALNKQFEQLSPEAQAIYREARDAYKAHHRNVIEAIKERVKRSEMGSERKAELLRKMDSEFYKAIQGVYFPLARFGSYVVAVNGPDGKIASVHRAETMGEANALREQLQQKFPRDSGYDVGKVTLDKEFVASRDSVSRGFMSELYGALDGMKLPSSQLAELEDTLGQLYLASMPDLSWAKHGIHRKGTAGFSDDARRAFAQNLFHGARYLAKLRYGDRMQDELDRMQKYADARKQDADYDQPKAQRVIDEMVKRHESMMNPKSNPLSTALTSFGFIYYLGLSPAAAVVNLTQTALVAYPVMGAKWGFNKSAAALMKASNEAVRGKNDITKSLNPEELKAFEKAVRDGTIDVTQAHDLAGIAQGEDSKVMWKIRPVMRMASYMFHQAEVFNRQVTFIASYRLAREAGASTTAAYEQAKKATYDGHFDYSASNRPRLMQGNVAKVVLLFKQYAQNMIYTLTRNTYQAFAGESPAVRKEARKTIGAILALHAAAAGVLGLPLVGPLLALASAVGGDDDEPWDAEVALRNLLADALGPKASEVIARGLSRLGPADISGRVALNNLLLPDVQEGLEGKKLAEAWTSAMLGPVAGIFTNAAVGANHIAEGRYAMGLESMLPVALRNPLKSLRYAVEGEVDRSGVVVLDEVSYVGIASQLVGFSPSEVRLSFEGKSAIFDADRRLSNRRSELMTQFARAAMEGDQEGMAEAREAIAAFNQKNPSRRIQANHLMQSVQARRRRIAQAEDGVYLPRNRADAREAGRFANPE